MSDGGKGSAPRPYSVAQHEYDTRWDAIFRHDLEPAVKITESQEKSLTTDTASVTIEE